MGTESSSWIGGSAFSTGIETALVKGSQRRVFGLHYSLFFLSFFVLFFSLLSATSHDGCSPSRHVEYYLSRSLEMAVGLNVAMPDTSLGHYTWPGFRGTMECKQTTRHA